MMRESLRLEPALYFCHASPKISLYGCIFKRILISASLLVFHTSAVSPIIPAHTEETVFVCTREMGVFSSINKNLLQQLDVTFILKVNHYKAVPFVNF